MPKLWKSTIEEHRREVRDAILDATAALAAEHGVAGVTMSAVATGSGVGRATLYKYFPDVQAILVAWHERQVSTHVQHLVAIRDHGGTPLQRLERVLTAYAFMSRGHHGGDVAALLHQGAHVARAHRRLRDLVRDLLIEGAGDVRTDVAPAELAAFCLHALGAAAEARSKAAVERLVDVVLAGVRARTRR
jgi:AcrR family transcriptional regulator